MPRCSGLSRRFSTARACHFRCRLGYCLRRCRHPITKSYHTTVRCPSFPRHPRLSRICGPVFDQPSDSVMLHSRLLLSSQGSRCADFRIVTPNGLPFARGTVGLCYGHWSVTASVQMPAAFMLIPERLWHFTWWSPAGVVWTLVLSPSGAPCCCSDVNCTFCLLCDLSGGFFFRMRRVKKLQRS